MKHEKSTIMTEENLIEDLQKSGCPICNYIEEILFDFLASWQYALSNDENVQDKFAADRGFCPAHTWQLAAVSSPGGISRGYPEILKHIAGEISKMIDAFPDISVAITALVKDSEDCRVCHLLRDKEKTYARRLADFLDQEGARAAYSRSDGVCLRHLSMLVSFLSSKEIVGFLLSETERSLKENAEDMQRYVIKLEALERHLLTRDERRAYLRVLVKIAGARNVCAPHVVRI